jgi:integrase/recombinase XerD
VLPIPDGYKIALHKYFKNRLSTAHQEVFLSRRGQPLCSAQISRRLRVLAKRAGLPEGRGAHAIRRAVGTRLVEQDWGLGQVALVLGQGSIDSARIYLRISSQLLRDVALNYGELL